MYDLKRSIRRHAVACAGLLCLILVVASTSRCTSDSITGGENPVPENPEPQQPPSTTGTIRVRVMSDGSLTSNAVTLTVTGPAERTTAAVVGTTSMFADLPPGTYAIAATSTRTFIACQSTSANLSAGETTTAEVICARRTGTLAGTVSSGGAPIDGATVKLSGSTNGQTTTGLDGTFSIVVTVGEITLTTVHGGFVCLDRTILVEENQTNTADISCTAKTTGSIGGRVIMSNEGGGSLGDVTVTLTGPSTLTTKSSNYDGHFAFEDLAPGGYIIAATILGMDCPVVSAEVHATRTTEVLVECTFPNPNFPTGSEIDGAWWYYRLLHSQTGSCPTPLSDNSTGSMRFDSSNNTISIVGLDPQVTIVGPYDKGSGSYRATGKTVLGDGSSIETDMVADFSFDWWGYSDDPTSFSTDFQTEPVDVMRRRHRDPGGNLVCTEIYQASGSR